MLASQFAVQTKATVYIEDENGTILYSSDELQTTTDQDSIATIQESTDTIIVTTDNDELLSEIGYPFTLFGSEYTLCVQGDTVSINQATEAIWQTIPLVIFGIFLISIVCSGIYSRYNFKSEVKENGKSKDNGGFGPDSIDGNGSSRSDEWDCRGSYTGFISK